MSEKSFKKFLEEEERKSPYISSLENEIGIDPRDLEKEPQIASFFSIGGMAKNIGSYTIVSLKRNQDGEITHAVVKKNNDPAIKSRTYKDKDDKMTGIEAEEGEQTFIVSIEDLDKLLSQDFQPQPGGMA